MTETRRQMALNCVNATYMRDPALDEEGKPAGIGVRKVYDHYAGYPIAELKRANEIANAILRMRGNGVKTAR